MDDYLDHFLSSASWSDVNGKENSYWGSNEPDQLIRLLPNSFGLDEEDKYSSPVSMVNSNQSLESLAAQDTSTIILKGEPDLGLDQDFLSAQLQIDGQNCNDNAAPNGTINGGLETGPMGLQSNVVIPTLGSVDDMARSSVPCSGDRPSEFHRPIRDLQTLSLIPQLWPPPSYESFSSLFPVMGEERVHDFDLPGKQVNKGTDLVMNGYLGLDKGMQYDNLSAIVSRKEKQDMHCDFLSSFAAGPQMSMKSAGLNPLHQATPTTISGSCNGTAKPRQRARRGQATDPHSIAERLRREKISERMKNLQELVPNSNKTDKASMLDEIIDYVKFLQLQVKVLSMSRLGAAGAVVPLITDSQAEGSSNGISLSPSAGQVVDDSQSPSQIAFEQEIVKLMESSVTMAMQYLQRKGLCLMPIALAAAISNGKTSSLSPEEKIKFGSEDSLVQNTMSSSNSSSSSLPQITCDGGREGNTCSRAVKQEVKSDPRSSREIKPKA